MNQPAIEEKWFPIKDFETLYHISNYGRVKSLHGKQERLHKICKGATGYPIVSLAKKGTHKTFFVHLLVVNHILSRPKGMVTNHLDGNKFNNHVSNLEFCTQSENIRHALRTGLSKTKLKEGDVEEIMRKIHQGETKANIAREYKVNPSVVYRIYKLNGQGITLNKRQ